MLPGILPEKYEIPKFHGPSASREFEDNSFFILKPDQAGILTIEGEDGFFKIKEQRDIPKLFRSKYNWTFSRFNEWEGIFKFFSSEQLFNLKMIGELEFGRYKIHWIVGTHKIRLTVGGNTRTSKFLINVAHWILRDYPVKDLGTLKDIVDKLIWINQYIPINITSPASTTKDLLLATGKKDFAIYNKLPLDSTKFLHTCYVGPRMESQCLGTIDNVDNLDLEKAYLRALGKCPSIAKDNLFKVIRGTQFDEDAHPGSGYEIEVTVPDTYKEFSPIPHRGGGCTSYPHGKFVTRVSKPYIELLNTLKDVPYRILDSVQLILVDPHNCPFKTFSQILEFFENHLQKDLSPVNLKSLHYAIQGHMLHIHRNVDLTSGIITYETSQDYNPVDASGIQAMVACELFRFATSSNTEAIRVDALSGYGLRKRDGYRQEPTGLMTFLTTFLKDKPGSTLYRDLIYKNRDLRTIVTKFPVRHSLAQSWHRPRRIGSMEMRTVNLEPLSGNREATNLEGIKRMGELLDRRVYLPIPHYDRDNPSYPQGLGPSYKEEPIWVDDYLHLFPQIPT